MNVQTGYEALASRRSILCCPASSATKSARAAASPADGVLLDLEDAVAPNEKADARNTLLSTMNECDFGERVLTVRVNDLNSGDWHDDLDLLREPATGIIAAICVPKVCSPEQLQGLDNKLADIDRDARRDRPLLIELLIEDVQAIEHLYELSRQPRVGALVFGPGDFGASLGARRLPELDGQFDPLLIHRTLVLTAARATGVTAVDGPSADMTGGSALRSESAVAAACGYMAKWAIHPAQLDCINMVFTPSAAEIERALQIVGKPAEDGAATTVAGEFVDKSVARQARSVLARANSSQSTNLAGEDQ